MHGHGRETAGTSMSTKASIKNETYQNRRWLEVVKIKERQAAVRTPACCGCDFPWVVVERARNAVACVFHSLCCQTPEPNRMFCFIDGQLEKTKLMWLAAVACAWGALGVAVA